MISGRAKFIAELLVHWLKTLTLTLFPNPNPALFHSNNPDPNPPYTRSWPSVSQDISVGSRSAKPQANLGPGPLHLLVPMLIRHTKKNTRKPKRNGHMKEYGSKNTKTTNQNRFQAECNIFPKSHKKRSISAFSGSILW